MSLKINGKTTEATLTERLADDAKILGDVSGLFTFAAAAFSGEPLGTAAGIALILKAAGNAVGAGAAVVRRLVNNEKKDSTPDIPPYERFRVLFYSTCQQCFIEALSDTLKKHDKTLRGLTKKDGLEVKEVPDLKLQIRKQIEVLGEAEITYLLCIEPLTGEVPFYDAFEKWTSAILAYYGVPQYEAIVIAQQSNKDARQRFHVFLASKDDAAEWMRNYLALTRQEETTKRLVTDLVAIRETLAQWTDPIESVKLSQKKAWDNYRRTLTELPDLKETMFSEQFGVRKVFVQPSVLYHVRGAEGDAGKPQPVPDLARLLGALISSRLSGEDLIILCGGPGSGKSTLCRIISSELAQDPNVHPVFLRLRRVREGAEIGQFIEESLQKQGLISRLADLRDIPNLILILDGFDELVMASRSRLRHFFNVLREDLSSGPLKNARAIVSGRDTLFPRGEGLPMGSHLLSLQSFDKLRVKAWGTKWRLLHKTGPGSNFHPEEFIEEKTDENPKSPLHHLVSWPLTLHLVARVHTAGNLEVRANAAKKIEKAYLYRSILAETSHRQVEQAEGSGRFDQRKMRDFLRELAWEMHSGSKDSMDPSDVMPILKKFYPETSEQDLAELAEVAVVNSPELTKGEETGFEFVHKSFAEFLVGERFADLVERVAFKALEYGTDQMTWRMSEQDAARELSPVLAIRPIPQEVQEMFEPMLGCFVPFSKGEHVDEVVTAAKRKDGLVRIVERFELILESFLRGSSLETVAKIAGPNSRLRSSLEAYANFCAGVLIVGTAASRQLRQFDEKGKRHRGFSGEPFKGAFWRCFSILAAGGISLDETLADRVLDGMKVVSVDDTPPPSDLDSPLRLGFLSIAEGYRSSLAEHITRSLRYVGNLERTVLVMQMVTQLLLTKSRYKTAQQHTLSMGRNFRMGFPDHELNPVARMAHELSTSGLIPQKVQEQIRRSMYDIRGLMERIEIGSRDPREASDMLRRIISDKYFHEERFMFRESGWDSDRPLEYLLRDLSRQLDEGFYDEDQSSPRRPKDPS